MHGVSVILPCYGAKHYLREAVASVVSQPMVHDFEVIVVDDDSPDEETQRQLEQVQSHDEVSVIRQPERLGAQRARNVGLEQARYDYVLMMDADDRLNLDGTVLEAGTYTDRAIDILAAQADVAFVHSATWMFGEVTGPADTAYPLEEWMVAHKHHAPTWIIYRRANAIEAGMYDESIAKWQDWSFAVALLSFRHKFQMPNEIRFLPEPYYLYRIYTSALRISLTEVDEREMVKRTLYRHPELFHHYYPGLSASEQVERVLANKPKFLKTFHQMLKGNPRAVVPWTRQRIAEWLRGAPRLGTQ